jgi:hypothetical protein
MPGEPMKRTRFATMLSILACVCLGNGRSCAVAEPHASPEAYLAAARFDSDAASKSPRSGQAEEKIKLDWLLAQDTPPTTSEGNGTTVIAIFPSSTPQAVEGEIAKAHKLEFVRRLNTGSAEGRATLYRITDGRAAAEVVAALKGDVRVSAARENVRYSPAPQAPVPAGVSGARPSPTHPRPPTEGQRNASRPDAKPNVSDRASRTAQRLGKARDQVVADSAAILGSGQRSSLVTSKHTALRFPTADEPFVNIGARNK